MWRTTGEAEERRTAGDGPDDTPGSHPEKDDGRLISRGVAALYGAG
jgi:hypothetical protein